MPLESHVLIVGGSHTLAELLGDALAVSQIGVADHVPVRAACGAIRESSIDAVIIDASAQQAHDCVCLIRRRVDRMPLVVMNVAPSAAEIMTWFDEGVIGVATEATSREELIAIIRSAMCGQRRCASDATPYLVDRIKAVVQADSSPHRTHARLSGLTEREFEVLCLVARGCANKEIATRLGLEVSTVKNHLHHIFRKVGVEHRRQAARYVDAAGLASSVA